ncbi:hypothetical protein D3C72_1053820 [compost metagenome]
MAERGQRVDRADEHQLPAAALDHGVAHRLHAMERAIQVELDVGLPVLRRGLAHRRPARRSHVRHQHIHRADSRNGRGHLVAQARAVGDVRHQRMQPRQIVGTHALPGQHGRQAFQCARVVVQRDQPVAGLQHAAAQGLADAARGARDQRHAPGRRVGMNRRRSRN